MIQSYLAELSTLLGRATSTATCEITEARRGQHLVRLPGRVQPVATLTRAADAELFVRAVPELRTSVDCLARLVDQHRSHPGVITCRTCEIPAPCATARTLGRYLAARARTVTAADPSTGPDQIGGRP